MTVLEDTSVKVPTPIIQLLITLALSAASAYAGVVTGNAVTKAQMLDFDKRLSKVEGSLDRFQEQQIEIYKSQIVILQRELEHSSNAVSH